MSHPIYSKYKAIKAISGAATQRYSLQLRMTPSSTSAYMTPMINDIDSMKAMNTVPSNPVKVPVPRRVWNECSSDIGVFPVMHSPVKISVVFSQTLVPKIIHRRRALVAPPDKGLIPLSANVN